MNSGRREKQAAAKQTEKMIKVRINMTSKERAELKTQAMKLDSIFQIGKASLTPAMVNAVKDALHARELIKVSVLKNCLDDPHEIAQVLAERTGSEVVQVIGKKIVLVANLKPAKLCGVESCGMICAADMPNGDVKVIFPDESLPVGSKIR